MRIVLATMFLCFLMPDAHALQKINADDYNDIVKQLEKKNAAERAIAKNSRDRVGATAEKKAELDRDLVRLKRERKAAYEQAMWRTIKAYEIIPIVDNDPLLPSGFSVERSTQNGKSVKWIPIFDEIGVKPRQDEFGNTADPKEFSEINAGNTASDGVSRIFPSAFDNPSVLASYIIHEVRHFWQMVTPDKGDKMTASELEVEAYEEELRLLNDPDNPLGYTVETRRDHAAHLKEMLEGDGKRNPGFRKSAKKERAEANKKRGGLPLPGLSIVSFSTAEIDSLVEQAKGQIIIAQRDHDERLRNEILGLTSRSCSNPGSVTQSDLDALSKPHHRDFLNQGAVPADRRKCMEVYFYLGRGGRDAEEVRSISAPPPEAVSPIQPTPIAPLKPNMDPYFWTIFPQLADFSKTACQDLNQVGPINELYGTYNVSLRDRENKYAVELAAGLDNCARQLFFKIIEKTRDNRGEFSLTKEWVKAVVAANSPAAGSPPGSAPPADGVPPRETPKHPIVIIPDPPWKGRSILHEPAH